MMFRTVLVAVLAACLVELPASLAELKLYYYDPDYHCGVQRSKFNYNALKRRHLFSKRIVGGEDSERGEWPWLVSIYYKSDDSHFCGGALINDKWIITAAHCFHDGPNRDTYKDDIGISVGEHSMNSIYEQHESYHYADRLVIHPQYDAVNIVNDIALIELDDPATPNKYVSYACMPPESHLFDEGWTCLSAGWGHTAENGDMGEHTKHVRMKLRNGTVCSNAYDDFYTDKMICAGGTRSGHDTCQGDSGGPLMCRRLKNDAWAVIGVVSYGDGCGHGSPGVYTRVEAYMPWIKQTMGIN